MPLILPPGTLLFHGTCEPFPIQSTADLRPVIDDMFWTARDSAIAQCYIPTAGSSVGFQLRHLLEPMLNGEICPLQQFQKEMGLEFGDITWTGTRATSYRIIKDPRPETRDWKTRREDDRRLLEKFAARLREMGYEPSFGGDLEYSTWTVKTEMVEGEKDHTRWEFRPKNWTKEGRLIALRATRPVKILDIATGDDGDLLDPDYRQYDLFRRIHTEGKYTGIHINDFAQVGDDHSNFGHQAIGLTKAALQDGSLRLENVITARHPLDLFERNYRENQWVSTEWAAETRKKAA